MDFLYSSLKSKTEPRANVLWETGFPWCYPLRMKSKQAAFRADTWGVTVIWTYQNLCLISKFERRRKKIREGWLFTGPTKICAWFQNSKEAEGKIYVRDDCSLGQLNLCLVPKFERSCRTKICEGWLFTGPTKICVWFQNFKEAAEQKYVRDDCSLGQPKFVLDSKIWKKLQDKNMWGMTVHWANQNLCLISKFERSCRKTCMLACLTSLDTLVV